MDKTPEEIKKHKHQLYANCLEESRERRKEYRKTNAEHIAKKKKEIYQKNIDHYKAQHKKYRENNKELVSAQKKRYTKTPGNYDTWFPKLEKYYEPDQIRRDPDNPEKIQVRCHNQNCQGWFNPTNQELENRYKSICGTGTGECHLYCSEHCKLTCPTFGQISRLKTQKIPYTREVQPELRKLVLERDNYTCQREECRKSRKDFPGLRLHCHHINPINEDPICSADIDNCITLCAECHKWVHENIPGCSYAELKCSKKEENQ